MIPQFRSNFPSALCTSYVLNYAVYTNLYCAFKKYLSWSIKSSSEMYWYLHSIPLYNHARIYLTVGHKFSALFIASCRCRPSLYKQQKASLSPVYTFSFCFRPELLPQNIYIYLAVWKVLYRPQSDDCLPLKYFLFHTWENTRNL